MAVPTYYTVSDIVEYYGISDKTVWRWIGEGRVRAKRRSVEGEARRCWCVTPAEFDRIETVMVYNQSKMPAALRVFNDERNRAYRERESDVGESSSS